MFPGRFMSGQSSAVRKPRVEGKQSMLPKPRRPGSTDRASVDARRPSTSLRSSSAEPVRATMAGTRPSREASASKIPMNRRSRSQQADRYGQSSMTPLRSSHFARTTTTPVRTPSEDRQSRSWQASLDRALASVTIKDQRPISNVTWQRAEMARVSEALALRGGGGGGGGGGGALALIRPLTITRFVDICDGLLAAIMQDTARGIPLNNDNYVARLPLLAKRFLYPGAVSKSWLKTVNTLHAFPHALAFIAYFLDLVNHLETPVSDEWLYLEKGELAGLRRDFLNKCWIRFQDPKPEFEDLNAEYLQELKQLLGHDEQRVAQLKDTIKECQAALEDPGEVAARAEAERLRTRRDALATRLREGRAERRAHRAALDAQRARDHDQRAAARALDNDVNNITAEIQQLKRELETQELSVAERARLLDETEYAARVLDSKLALTDQVHKILVNKECELAEWQQRALDSCVQYRQALIDLSARFPDLADLAIDEQQLMEPRCAAAVSRAVDTLRECKASLAGSVEQRERAKSAHCRQRHQLLEDIRARETELKAVIARERQCLEAEESREAGEAAAWAAERERLAARIDALQASLADYTQAQAELDFWEKQDVAWSTRLSEQRAQVRSVSEQLQRAAEEARRRRAHAVLDAVSHWHRQLDRAERTPAAADTHSD